MIVDIYTHVWDTIDRLGPAVAEQFRWTLGAPMDQPNATPEVYVDAMRPADVAVVHGFVSRHLEANLSTKWIAKVVASHPDRYVGFAGIDCTQRDCLDAIDQAVDAGMVGVTVSHAAQNIHPSHSHCMALYEKCERMGLPVFFLMGVSMAPQSAMQYAQPVLLDDIARSFPELKLVISQLGYPWVEQTIELVAKCPNVFAELSDLVRRPYELYQALLVAHQRGALDRLLLGSGFPFCTPAEAITNIYSINGFTHGTPLPAIPRERLRQIVERDSLSVLDIAGPDRDTASSGKKVGTASTDTTMHEPIGDAAIETRTQAGAKAAGVEGD